MTAPGRADFWISPDGSRLGRMRWEPNGPPRARVIALHGLSCRVEDFAPLGERLQRRGITTEAWNLRGQGLDPVKSRRGAWLHVAGILADLEAFAGPTDNTPLFLCGDSMGALLAIQAATRQPWLDRLAGLLLFVPVVGLAQKNPAWVKPALHAVSRVLPGLRLKPSWFVQGSAAMPILTRDPARQHEVATAPHRLGPTTLGFLARMGDLIEAASPAAANLQTPVAIFSAGHDVFVTTEQQREFFARIGTSDKTHFHYPEAYHQLLFDLDAREVLDDAAGWIDARLATRTSPR